MGWGLGIIAVNKTKIPALVEFTFQWGRQLRKKVNESKSTSDGEKSYGKNEAGKRLLFLKG